MNADTRCPGFIRQGQMHEVCASCERVQPGQPNAFRLLFPPLVHASEGLVSCEHWRSAEQSAEVD